MPRCAHAVKSSGASSWRRAGRGRGSAGARFLAAAFDPFAASRAAGHRRGRGRAGRSGLFARARRFRRGGRLLGRADAPLALAGARLWRHGLGVLSSPLAETSYRRRRQQRLAVLEGQALRIAVLRNLGVAGLVLDVGPIAAVEHLDPGVRKVQDEPVRVRDLFLADHLERALVRDGVRIVGLERDVLGPYLT